MKENTHVQAIPENILTSAQTKIQEVLTLLPLICAVLDPGGTTGNAQNGRKGHRFCGKSLRFCQAEPQFSAALP
jgi:hypothetical protein